MGLIHEGERVHPLEIVVLMSIAISWRWHSILTTNWWWSLVMRILLCQLLSIILVHISVLQIEVVFSNKF